MYTVCAAPSCTYSDSISPASGSMRMRCGLVVSCADKRLCYNGFYEAASLLRTYMRRLVLTCAMQVVARRVLSGVATRAQKAKDTFKSAVWMLTLLCYQTRCAELYRHTGERMPPMGIRFRLGAQPGHKRRQTPLRGWGHVPWSQFHGNRRRWK